MPAMKTGDIHSINQQDNDALLLAEQSLLLLQKEQIIEKKSEVISEQKKRIAILEEALRLSKIKRFAPSSEKSNQQSLFDEAEVCAEQAVGDELNNEPEKPAKKNQTGRKPFSDKLPRVQIFINLSDEEKAGAVDTFYSKVKEELDIIPAKVRVLEYMQEKAVFIEQGERQIKAATLPRHPIARAMGSISLMSFVLIAKYADGLPLYRLEKILARYGGETSRATLANWIIALAKQLQPLINLLREHQHSGALIQADETRIQVLKEPDHVATSDKYMWITRGGPPGEMSVLFEYDPSRNREVPLRLLDGFSGYLQTDGYAGYNAACKKFGITQLGCMDHARRKFVEAQDAQPKSKKKKAPSKADMALSYINKLYGIERSIKEFTADKKYQVRQEKSVPILKQLREYLEKNQHKVPKDSLTGKAMTYLNNQWEKLIVYCSNGELSISNILAENAIRPFVIGRKAWLFSDTPAGAHASATHYSLIETAKLNGLEPYDYLNRVLTALPYADTVEKLEMLLPWNIKNLNLELLKLSQVR